MTEKQEELYKRTKERMRRLGIENPADVIVALAEEIENLNPSEGEWIETDYKTVEYGFVERRGKAWLCTNCRHASKEFNPNMKFCPNCGAKMTKETAEKHFTPEEVRKMSPAEVKENYSAIMDSMKEWK